MSNTFGKHVKVGKNVWRKNLKSSHTSSADNIDSTARFDKNRVDNETTYFETPLQIPQISHEACSKGAATLGCGSCQLVDDLDINYEKFLEEKAQKQFEDMQKMVPIRNQIWTNTHKSPRKIAYRSLIKFVVQKRDSSHEEGQEAFSKTSPMDVFSGLNVQLGLYEEGSHKLIPIQSCKLQKTILNKLVYEVAKNASDLKISPYDPDSKTGSFRYLVARAAHFTDEVQIVFVRADTKSDSQYRALYSALRKSGFKISGCFLNDNASEGNAIFGERLKSLGGVSFLRERLCDLNFFVGPKSFFQINPWQAESIYQRISQIVGPAQEKDCILDLYCGVGQIGAVLAKQKYKVVGIEENEEAVSFARRCFESNDLEGEFHSGRTEDQLDLIREIKTRNHFKYITMNPSRRGMAKDVIELVSSMAKEQKSTLVYLSCDHNSLARDLQHFVANGMEVLQMEAYDMFPFTPKLEWLCILGRKAN